MKIVITDKEPKLQTKLEEFTAKHQLLFNSKTWRSNYPADSVVQCAILNNNNDVIGCFNYFIFSRWRFKFVITPPYSPHIGLFFVNPSESVVGRHSFEKDIFTLMADHLDSLSPSHIHISFPYSTVDTQPFIWKGYNWQKKEIKN